MRMQAVVHVFGCSSIVACPVASVALKLVLACSALVQPWSRTLPLLTEHVWLVHVQVCTILSILQYKVAFRYIRNMLKDTLSVYRLK